MEVTTEIAAAAEVNGSGQQDGPSLWIYLLFFASGIPAITYQIAWQRALFALYGINIESVTIVVSAFMLGLGLGSLAGGVLSRSKRLPPIALFAVAELGIAIFALTSLSMFKLVAEYTRAKPLWVTGIISFLLVVIPTAFMGSTLPILLEHLVRTSRNVGSSIGALYFVNTLGSGVACLVVVRPLMSYIGQAGTVRCAALVNGLVGVSALVYSFRWERDRLGPADLKLDIDVPRTGQLLPFALALFYAGFCGFTALSYEIIWYRLLAFALRDTAPTFVSLLGSYLVGLALGSRFAEAYTERHPVEDAIRILPIAILGSAVVSFWINPVSVWALKMIRPDTASGGFIASLLFLALICHAAILFGALFPLIAYVAVGPRRAGTTVSYLYAANIVGATLGVLLVGFVLMNRVSLYWIACALLIGGVLCAATVRASAATRQSRTRVLGFVTACIAAVIMAPFSRPVFDTIYDRLLFKKFYPAEHFVQVIDNRSGTIGVTPEGILYGGGVYDGAFNTDLLNDTNIIVRPYALSAFHASPSHVLMVGLGSGSWAQVIANNPQLQDLTIVDINPGYLEAISQHQATKSLLHNPRVTIVIDDGRRWLLRHPRATFDVVVMNTSFYWRNHSSNLLSADFLQIVRPHLRPNGVFFYNTTWSDDVAATGLASYPYALRVFNCLALSDSPLVFDRVRWKSVLLSYIIDGRRVINRDNPEHMKKLNQIVGVRDAAPLVAWASIETDEEIRRRLKGRNSLIITDDNMGLEWR
jgi:spermidine synthase